MPVSICPATALTLLVLPTFAAKAVKIRTDEVMED